MNPSELSHQGINTDTSYKIITHPEFQNNTIRGATIAAALGFLPALGFAFAVEFLVELIADGPPSILNALLRSAVTATCAAACAAPVGASIGAGFGFFAAKKSLHKEPKHHYEFTPGRQSL